MQHIHFFKKILSTLKSKNIITLSGLIGDIWSGNIKIGKINNFTDLNKLFLTHGISIPKKYIKFDNNYNQSKNFFNSNKYFLSYENLRLIFLVRFKIILLQYLISVPEYLGKITITPFLNYRIVSNILAIDPKRRKNRKWQVFFFKKSRIYIEDYKLKVKKTNYVSIQAAILNKFEKINARLVSSYFSINFLKEINARINKIDSISFFFEKMNEYIRRFGQILKKFFRNNYSNILGQYLIIKTIEKSIK